MNRGLSRSVTRTERQARGSREKAPTDNPVERERWPDVRIVRRVLYDDVSADTLRSLADNLGERNYGLGEARVVGSMAMTLVDAQAMGRMLNKKYRKAYESPKKTREVVRKFAKEFNSFVTQDEQRRDRVAQEKADAKRLIDPERFVVVMPKESGDTGYCFVRPDYSASVRGEDDAIFLRDPDDIEWMLDDDEVDESADELQKRRWNQGDFKVRKQLKPYGNNYLGFDLSDNPQLYEEFDAIELFLRKDLKLDTKLMLPREKSQFRFVPHVTVFRTVDIPERTNLFYTVAIPDTIPLDRPEAI